MNIIMKITNCKSSVEILGIFGLKTPLHAHEIGEHPSMKNDL